MEEAHVRQLLWMIMPSSPRGHTEDWYKKLPGNRVEPWSGRSYCKLCRETVVENGHHIQSVHHQLLAAQLIRYRDFADDNMAVCLRNTITYESRILSLGLASWRDELRRILIPYDKINFRVHIDVFPNIDKKLGRFELMERTALLELVAWKMVIFMSFPPNDLALCLDFVNKRWKGHKKENRQHNSIGIIVRRVLPFLGQGNV